MSYITVSAIEDYHENVTSESIPKKESQSSDVEGPARKPSKRERLVWICVFFFFCASGGRKECEVGGFSNTQYEVKHTQKNEREVAQIHAKQGDCEPDLSVMKSNNRPKKCET